jgi:hypothetical protein
VQRALDIDDKVLQGQPRSYTSLQGRIEELVMMGRIAEAKEAARTMMTFYPKTSISASRLRWPHRPPVVERMVQIFRAAGIPE